jgi:hypothetical protein
MVGLGSHNAAQQAFGRRNSIGRLRGGQAQSPHGRLRTLAAIATTRAAILTSTISRRPQKTRNQIRLMAINAAARGPVDVN